MPILTYRDEASAAILSQIISSDQPDILSCVHKQTRSICGHAMLPVRYPHLDRAIDFLLQFLGLSPVHPLFLATIRFFASLFETSETYLHLFASEPSFVHRLIKALDHGDDFSAYLLYTLCDSDSAARAQVRASLAPESLVSLADGATPERSTWLLTLLSAHFVPDPPPPESWGRLADCLTAWPHPAAAPARYWREFVICLYDFAGIPVGLTLLVERGVFPQMLPDVTLLCNDWRALRTFLALFAWAIHDGLVRQDQVPIALFFQCALHERLQVSATALNCLAQIIRQDWVESVIQEFSDDRVMAMARHVFGHGFVSAQCNMLEILGAFLFFTDVSTCNRIAEEPFLDAVFDMVLIDDGDQRIWAIGFLMVLARAAQLTGDGRFLARIRERDLINECCALASAGNEDVADLLKVLPSE
jgi:hypothetical protein